MMGLLFWGDKDDVSFARNKVERPRKLPVVEVLANEDVQAAIDKLAAEGGGTVVVTGEGAFTPNLTHANGVDLIVNPSADVLRELRSLMGTR